ncbi:MAG TPA: SPW repeat protein [Candidatus Baltobacteraceae bacterium]|jgi:hypothetical protein
MDVPNRVPWVNIAIGILTIISPFVNVPTGSGARWDMVVTGIVIAVVAIIEMSVYTKSQSMNYWPVVNIIAGIWLFISTTFVQGNTGMIWSNIVMGVAAIVTGLVALSYERVHANVPHNAQHV